MGINLAEELLLLAYDDSGSANAGTPALDFGLAGGLLLELALAGRIDVVNHRVVGSFNTRTGDPLADAALSQINTDEKSRTPQDWVGRLSQDLRARILAELVADNVLRLERDKALWIFPRTRYPSSTGELPSAEAEARRRLDAAAAGVGPVDPRTAALCVLVRALHLERTAVPHRPRKDVRERFKTIIEQRRAERLDRRAVEEIETAVITAIAAVTVITTTAAAT